ncbi:MAG: UDP-glucose--hexose-1-phosphate uridylyltransferase [Methylocystis sp.]
MSDFLQSAPHRRFNALTGAWVLVSPHRTQRPWRGQLEASAAETLPRRQPGCYLCPGELRANGERNPDYETVYVFDNDFPALLPDGDGELAQEDELLLAYPETGLCRVLCFSPRHDLTLSRMESRDIAKVVEAWRSEYMTLGAREDVRYVQIFENRGAMMGASNPHPHCQIWASASVPEEPLKEDRAQAEYLARRGSCLLCDYLARESAARERVICENDAFLVVVPFWAVWPFETMIVSRRHFGGLDEMTIAEGEALADVLKRLTTRYDNLFDAPFPYTMGLHPKPTDGRAYPHWHFHAHFYPPLLRSATIRKFMVGYEMLATPQRDITPEQAAARLRSSAEFFG